MIKQVRFGVFNAQVWYQGENDTDRATHYQKLLPLLINTWRKKLADPSLPVYLIQLPGYADYPQDSAAIIRQTQLQVTQTVPQVHLVSFIDGGEEHNIHPAHKEKMGKRLGKIVSGLQYSSTPYVYKSCLREHKLVLQISNCQKLVIKKPIFLQIHSKDKTENLEITDKDIKDNKIIIDLSKISEVKEVRYLYANYPQNIGLYNELDDPISPFVINI